MGAPCDFDVSQIRARLHHLSHEIPSVEGHRCGVTPTTTRRDVVHLVRRVAFGAPPERIDELAALGFDGAVDVLTDFTATDPSADAIDPPSYDTDAYLDVIGDDGADDEARHEAQSRARDERRELIRWWLRRMVVAEQPQREWLTLVWHDHFATSLAKVKIAELMHRHYTTLYEFGPGRFPDLVGAVASDPAMLIWLDGRRNTAAAPNENFARELFELFTLGHGGHGDQPYTEADVGDAARALAGWTISRRTGKAGLVERRRDPGTKTVLGTSGDLGLADVVAAATAHPACALHVVARLWSRLARPASADDPVVAELAGPFADDLDVAALVQRMLQHPDFRAPAIRTALVAPPVQFLVGTARALGIDLPDAALGELRRLGQVPFLPPDVGGWPANEAWISTATTHARLTAALAIADAATDAVARLAEATPASRGAMAAWMLGLDGWSVPTANALDVVRNDPHHVLAVAIASPERALS